MARPKKTDRIYNEELRDRILNESERLFARQGFGSTTTRAIAEAAGVNKNLIFYYFQNKAGLYQEVILRNIQPVYSNLNELLKQNLEPEELLEKVIESYYIIFRRKSQIIPPLMLRELADGAPRFLEFIEPRIKQLFPILMQRLDTSKLNYLNPLTFLSIIAVVVYSFSTMPIQNAILDATGETNPDDAARLDYIKTILKHGILK